MALAGTLSTMNAAELLQWIAQGHKSGTLVLRNGGLEKRIVFEKGRLISSASNDSRYYLGQFLVRHGYITAEEHQRALELQGDLRMFVGKILVDIEAIAEEDLLYLMKLKAEEEVCDVFLWEEGAFEFEHEMPTMALVPLHIDVQRVILEGSRRVDEARRGTERIDDGGDAFESAFDAAMATIGRGEGVAAPPAVPLVGDGRRRKRRRFHRAGCSEASVIPERSRVRLAGRDEALDKGFEPCDACSP